MTHSRKRRTMSRKSRSRRNIRGGSHWPPGYGTVSSGNDIAPTGGQTLAGNTTTTMQTTSDQSGGRRRRRRRTTSRNKRGGSGFAAAISQAIVPFGILGAQQMYGRRRSQSKRTKKAFSWAKYKRGKRGKSSSYRRR